MHVENTYKLYEADKLFLKNLMTEGHEKPMVLPYNADSVRARQVYLKSYPLTPDNSTLLQKTKLSSFKKKGYLRMKIAMLVALFVSRVKRSNVSQCS